MERIKIRKGFITGKQLKEVASKINNDTQVLIEIGAFDDARVASVHEIVVDNKLSLILLR